jgi:hypothetical protein
MDADMVMTYPVKGREEAKAALMTTAATPST